LIGDAMEDVGPILEHEPAAIEVMDSVLLDLARDTSEFADVVGLLPDETDLMLLVEFMLTRIQTANNRLRISSLTAWAANRELSRTTVRAI
jgi:hypothetical protein